MPRRIGSGVLVGALLLSASAASLAAEPHDIEQACPDGGPIVTFHDVPPDSVHLRAIECVSSHGIARGTSDGYYSPAGSVTRGQMASFLARTMVSANIAFDPPRADHFTDDDGSEHEEAINQLADAGIALGDGTGRFDPHRSVTRAQMASFLHRTHDEPAGVPLAPGADQFDDDDGSPHEESIDAVAAAGIAVGDGGRRFEPSALVRRDQMASFLARFLDVLRDRRADRAAGIGTAPPFPLTDAVAFQLDAAHTGSAGTPQSPASAPAHAWTADLGGEPSYPLIVGDTVFVLAAGDYEDAFAGASLYALDAATGAVRWQTEASPFHSWAAHAYGDGRVFTIDADGALRAFDAGTGQVHWTRDLPDVGMVGGPPVAYGDSLFVVADELLLVLDVATGETRWQVQLTGQLSAPTVTSEAVVVSTGCHGTYAYARDAAEGGLLTGPGGPVLLWHREPACWGGAWQHLVVHGGRVYSSTLSDGNLVLDAATGAEVGTHPGSSSPAFLGDTGFANDARGATIAFDASTAAVVWRKRGEGRFVVTPIVASGGVYAASVRGELYAFDPATGDAYWARGLDRKVLAQTNLDRSRPPAGLGAGGGLLAIPTEGGLQVFRDGA